MNRYFVFQPKISSFFINVFLILSISTFLHTIANAADENIGLGIGFGVWQTHEESDFEKDHSPFEIHYDHDFDNEWLKFRVGYNSIQGKLSFDAYGQTWKSALNTKSIYSTYRYNLDLAKNINVYGLAGIAVMMSNLQINHGIKGADSTNLGVMFGGGAYYILGLVRLGLQLQQFSGDATLKGMNFAVGSTQLLMTIGLYL